MRAIQTTQFLLALLTLTHVGSVRGQNVPFDSGSRGTTALSPTASQAIQIPPDGRLEFTTITIPAGVEITFIRNAANTPVYLLASGDVVIDGKIDVSAEQAITANLTATFRGSFGGPGGFNGGMPGAQANPPGNGFGPGGGLGDPLIALAGAGVYSTPLGAGNSRTKDGQIYGSQLLMPLVGGSGAGGTGPFAAGFGYGGGGGGGAILIASTTSIQFGGGQVLATGGGASLGNRLGSGGAIRLVAPTIRGTGALNVQGGGGHNNAGRIRCDMVNRENFALSFLPSSSVATTTESFMMTFPPVMPRLRFTQIAGQSVPADAPANFTVTLAPNSAAQQPIRIEASGFCSDVRVIIRLTPASGPSITLPPLTLNNLVNNPVEGVTVANFPANVAVTVEAWTE